jgi:hypothetical protein
MAPVQLVDARKLPPEMLERLRARATALRATRSGMQSEQLGCVAVLGIAGLIGVVVGVARAVQNGVDWVVIVAPLVGLGLLLAAFLMVQAQRTSPIPEFTLTTHAYHLISDGSGSIEAYCMPLCSKVRFVTVLLNGLYTNTVLEAHFGSQKVVLTETLAGPQRDRPWENERFGAFLSMMEMATQHLAQGQWSQVPGADLLPGEPPRPTAAPPNWRLPPETQPG